MPQWQRDRDVAGELVQKNANVFAHFDLSLKREQYLILAALHAEEQEKGNFHWEWVPEDTYRDIVKLCWGGDPNASTLLDSLLDPSRLKDPQRRFYLIDAMPSNALTTSNLLLMSRHFAASPEMFGRLLERMNTDPRATILRGSLKDVDGFLFPLLTGKRAGGSAVAAPEVMAYITPDTTGLTWKDIVQLARDTKTLHHIDIVKLSLADLQQISIAMPADIRRTIWATVSEKTLADFLTSDSVPHSAGPHLRNVPIPAEMIKEIGRDRITTLQKERLINNRTAEELLKRK